MKGVLCVQLGTPDSPRVEDVRRYLIEFLTDGHVIEKPWLLRQLLVRGVIVPKRVHDSSHNYQTIWQPEGSPLKIYTERCVEKLQKQLGAGYKVAYAMRYQNPSIRGRLAELLSYPLSELTIIPLFPQYARATSGSVIDQIFSILREYRELPPLRILSSFEEHPAYIAALGESLRPYIKGDYGQVIMSFHSLPEEVAASYKERCFSTAKALAAEVGLQEYTVSFQSKLGRATWIGPSTREVLQRHKKVLIICPSFVADCVETLHEIDIEERGAFFQRGGEKFHLVPCLNDHPAWIQALATMVGCG